MRKLLLFCLPVIVLISAAFTSSLPARKKVSQPVKANRFDVNDHLIADSIGRRMEAYYVACTTCPRPKNPKFTRNSQAAAEVKAYLEQNYIIKNEEQRMGRFQTDKDVERYRKSHNIQDNEERGRVKGFATVLYRYTVIPKNSMNGFLIPQQSRYIYSDETSICPPPTGPGCY